MGLDLAEFENFFKAGRLALWFSFIGCDDGRVTKLKGLKS